MMKQLKSSNYRKSFYGLLAGLFFLCFAFALHGQAKKDRLKTGSYFKIINYTSEMSISNQGSTAEKAVLTQRKTVTKVKYWYWEFIKKGEYYQIRNKATGHYIANFKQKNNGAKLMQTSGPGDGALWKPILKENGYYQFKNKYNGQFMANFKQKNNGAPICQTNSPGPGSLWRLVKIVPSSAKKSVRVDFRHSGAYVANFYVRYTLNGVRKKAEWKGKTAGWNKIYNVPANANNIEVHAMCATGLVWQPWNDIFKMNISRSKKFKVKGTTLHPSFEVSNI